MKNIITGKEDYYMIDGQKGCEFIRVKDAPTLRLVNMRFDSPKLIPIPEQFSPYCSNVKVWAIEKVSGYGVRDKGAWVVFDNEQEAKEYAHSKKGKNDERKKGA